MKLLLPHLSYFTSVIILFLLLDSGDALFLRRIFRCSLFLRKTEEYINTFDFLEDYNCDCSGLIQQESKCVNILDGYTLAIQSSFLRAESRECYLGNCFVNTFPKKLIGYGSSNEVELTGSTYTDLVDGCTVTPAGGGEFPFPDIDVQGSCILTEDFRQDPDSKKQSDVNYKELILDKVMADGDI